MFKFSPKRMVGLGAEMKKAVKVGFPKDALKNQSA